MASLKKLSKEVANIEKKKGRKLTESEVLNLVTTKKYFTLPDYNKLMNLRHIARLEDMSSKNDDGKAISNILDSKKAGSAFSGTGELMEPNDEYQAIQDALIIREALRDMSDAVESLLKKRQKRTRDRCRALFTAYCIKLVKDYEGLKDYGDLIKVLDSKIIETYKIERKIPTQSEIYIKYHPKVFSGTQESAVSMACKMSNEFIDDLSAILKKKYPKIVLPEY